MSPLQLLALSIVLALIAGLVLGGVTMAAHNFLFAVQRWREGWAAL